MDAALAIDLRTQTIRHQGIPIDRDCRASCDVDNNREFLFAFC